MDYKSKYLKYYKKYIKLSGGTLPQDLQSNSILKIYLKKNINWTPDNKELNLDVLLYNSKEKNNELIDVNQFIIDTNNQNNELLKQLEIDYSSGEIDDETYKKKQQELISQYTWNDYKLWEIVFLNSKPDFNKIKSGPLMDEQKDIISKNMTYQLFNDDFTYFNLVLIPFVLNFYSNNLMNLLSWANCDSVETIEYLMKDSNNSYGLKIKIPENSEVIVIGDIHSSFISLYHILKDLRSKDNYFFKDSLVLQDDKYIIFTGDIIDYGPYGLECLWFVFTLLYHNPSRVFILKGNHENQTQYSIKNQNGLHFSKQLDEQISNLATKDMIKNILSLLPTVLFVNFRGENYQFNHGSIDFDIAGFNDETGSFDREKSYIYSFLQNDDVDKILINFYNDKGVYRNNTYQWGDFYYNPFNSYLFSLEDIKKKLGVRYLSYLKARPYLSRPKHHYQFVKQYLETNNIKSIISGHQDNTSLGILPINPEQKEIIINSEGEKLEYSKGDGLIVTKFAHENNLAQDNYEILLKPGIDMYAVTLSTAVQSKFVNYHTYAIFGN
jgi:hypothetical protein